jgi:hypothetical protein
MDMACSSGTLANNDVRRRKKERKKENSKEGVLI